MVTCSRSDNCLHIYNYQCNKRIFSSECSDADSRGYSFYGNSRCFELLFCIVTNTRIYKGLCNIRSDDLIFIDIFYTWKITEKSCRSFCQNNFMQCSKSIRAVEKAAEKYFGYCVKASKKNKKVVENVLQYGVEMLYNIAIEFANISADCKRRSLIGLKPQKRSENQKMFLRLQMVRPRKK